MILHRFDDLRIGAAAADLDFLLSTKSLGEYQDMKVGKVEAPGTKVNVLGRTKVQTHDAFFLYLNPNTTTTSSHSSTSGMPSRRESQGGKSLAQSPAPK